MGRDECQRFILPVIFNFYSHALVGRDTAELIKSMVEVISTHTPSWGVTGSDFQGYRHGAHFYSHALVGRDDFLISICKFFEDFYSHALVGRDAIVRIDAPDYEISTHTPSWGVTDGSPMLRQLLIISTHTPSWGVTRWKNKQCL